MSSLQTKTNPVTLELIDQLARKASAGTLKRLYGSSGNPHILRLQQSLQADFAATDKGDTKHVISDAFDCYTVAYTYLWEMIDIHSYNAEDTIALPKKDGTEKVRTVFQWACVKVRKYIYSNKSLEGNAKDTYIEDMSQGDATGLEMLEREYIRAGRYEGIQTYTDYIEYADMLRALRLTERQGMILHMRMAGLSVTAIADRLKVSKQAIDNQLSAIRSRAEKAFPDAIRAFDLTKHR